MTAKEKARAMLAASPDGTITSAQVTAEGLRRSVLQELVESGELIQSGRGIYVRSDAWEDDMSLLQRRYARGIYSHDTALYLLGYSDRTPAQYTMTFPKGYNTRSLKLAPIVVRRVMPNLYDLGVVELRSPSGNALRAYDLERTLCDIVRGCGSDIQIINDAMKKYAQSPEKDIHKLLQYAQFLRVRPKIERYMEVLL